MLAIQLTATGYDHATIWPADAVILVLLLREPRSSWGWVIGAGWVANLAANALARGWSPVLLAYGGINMAQTALAAWLFLRQARAHDVFFDNRSIMRFALYAGVVAPAIGALCGSLITWGAFGEPFASSFVRWYLSNGLGLVVLTPFIGALLDGSYRNWLRFSSGREVLEASAIYAALAGITLAVFLQPHLPLLFLPVCLVVLVALRLGRLGTKLGVMIVALIGLGATITGSGPVAAEPDSPEFQALFFQSYLGVLLLTCLPIATIVSSRKTLILRLAEREEALRQILECTPNGCLGFDAGGACKWSVGPIRALLGLSSEEMIGRTSESVSLQVHEIVEELFRASRKAGVAGDALATRVIEFSPVRRPHLTLEGTIGILRQGAALSGVVITLRDVTERRAGELALLARSEADDLTGLCNRESFRSHLRSAAKDLSRPISLALIDIDRFHRINASHGHAIGDAVLFEVARRIKRSARDTDVVARLGGDDFALILRCDLLTARGVCERLTEAVRQSAVYNGEAISVIASVSCGVAQLRHGMSVEDASAAAHAALQDMKQSGCNGVRVAA
ncbi:diguanylate cyclase [Novosphingobium sp. 1949]|uniref:Diguanylate cyclase n=2 Tax=Novosphingobium organovorum TaxID=2930092 RepID=A0ABT0BAQ1_9SPHN|nr:diguanylate cyclase [Novosphingobium organovorum]